MAKVAWIGLGVMGYPMAGHIRKKGGHDLTVYNRNGAKAEAWAKEHPEERLGGMGAVIESENLRGWEKRPLWPTTKLNLIGHTPEGRQLRLYWFADFTLD